MGSYDDLTDARQREAVENEAARRTMQELGPFMGKKYDEFHTKVVEEAARQRDIVASEPGEPERLAEIEAKQREKLSEKFKKVPTVSTGIA